MADEGNHKPGDEIDPDATPSAEEIAASQRLRDALDDPSVPNGDADVARALRAAWSPRRIADDELDDLVEGSLAEDGADERRAAAELRASLELGGASSPEAELARALVCAWSPKPLSPAEHEAILGRALGMRAASNGNAAVAARSPRRTVVRVSFAFAGVVALAASVVLVLREAAPGPEVPLARARSTQPLFTEPFRAALDGDKTQASARIDRIALARASDFRNNRFAQWGVR